MKAAVIENGTVVNIIVVESLDALPGVTLVNGEGAAIGYGWDAESGTFSPPAIDVEALKESLRAAINAERDRQETLGFTYAGVRFDSDNGSVRRITNAAVAAQAALATGQPYAVDWTTEDNSVMSLDAAGVIALQATMVAVGAAIHYHARDLKAAVDAATTLEALEAIDITAGWPA